MQPKEIAGRVPDGVVVAVGAWLIYGLAYGPLYGLLGTHTGVTAFVPVVITAWCCGARAGAFAVLISLPTGALARMALGLSDANWFNPPALVGAAAMVMVGYAVGRIRDLRAATQREVDRRMEAETVLQRERRRLFVVNEIASQMQRHSTIEETVFRAVDILHRHFPTFRASYSTVDNGGHIAVLVSAQPGEDVSKARIVTPLVLNPDQIERLVQTDLFQVDNVSQDVRWPELSALLSKTGTEALLDAPTRHPGVKTGLLSFSSTTPHAWTELERRTLRDAADFLARSIDDTVRRQRLEESETRFRTMLEQHVDGVSVCVDRRIVYANPSTEAMLGRSFAEIVGHDPVEFLAPEHRTLAAARAAKVEAGTRQPLPSEYEALRSDGTRFPIETTSQRIVFEGQPAILATLRDLTEKKRVESAAQEAEAKYRNLVEHSLAGVYIVQDRRFAYVNPRLAEIMGYTQGEMLALPSAVALVAKEDRERIEEKADRRAVGPHESDHFYVRACRKDGQTIELEVHGGTTTYIGRPARIGTVLDVTERRVAEAQVMESETRFRTLFEEAPIGLVMTSPEGRIQRVNQSFCDMLGYQASELVSRSMADVTHHDDASVTPESVVADLAGARNVVRLQRRYARKDGTFVEAETTVSTVKDEHGALQYGVAMIEDVTEQRRLEEQLHQILRLESVGQIAGGVAHNFNNALMAISGYSELIARRFDAKDPARHDLEQIQRVAEQSAHLTRQLLAFSRRDDVNPTEFNINDVVASSRDLLSPLLNDDLRIRLRLGRELPSVNTDRSRLEQTISHLVVNASDAMPDGGLLTIETDTVRVNETQARSNPEATPGCYVRLVVRDSGVGMSEDTVARIFEPFFTTKEPGQGVGLGLAMVHGTVKQNGGFITVESTPEVGSTFAVHLPVADGVARAKPHADATGPTVH